MFTLRPHRLAPIALAVAGGAWLYPQGEASAAGPLPSAATLQARMAPELRPQLGAFLRLLIKLSRLDVAPEADDEPDASRGDAGLLPLALPAIVSRLDGVIPGLPTALLGPVQDARTRFDRALARLHEGASAGDSHLDYLSVTLENMGAGAGALDAALDLAAEIDPAQVQLLLPAVQAAREAARRAGQDLIDLAAAAGVDPARLVPARDAMARGDAAHAAGQYALAIGQYGEALGFVADLVAFNMDRFEQNLRSVFDTGAVGYAYALSQGGALARSGFNGLARTGADAPATLQSATRRMHMASVSKPLTAILTLPLLEANGLTPDSPIGPWLPSHWARSADFDAVTFRELMTHRSGVGQLGVLGLAGSSYPQLQAMVANPVTSKAFDYDNANFGLQRVLIARLMGIDAGAFGEFDGGVLTASAYLLRGQQVYGGVGVSFGCSPSAANPTIQYQFPDLGTPGYDEPDRSLQCGGYGAFMSAQSLAGALAHLRYTENLMSTAQRQAMKAGYLGWMDPERYDYAQGLLGVYHGHGGDWDHTGGNANGGLDTCVMMFPNQVEASLVVNSSRKASGIGYPNGGYQCRVLKWAFEDAWLAQ